MIEPSAPDAPIWARRLVESTPGGWQRSDHGPPVRTHRGPEFALVSARVDDAISLGENEFRQATTAAYVAIGDELERSDRAEAVRLWNFVPRILEPIGALPHRYMAFNAGRYDAYLQQHGEGQDLATNVPTASGVGHEGSALVVHCLASATPGRAVENPRQVPSCQYSQRYGPQPPCFARATSLESDAGRWLLVGGTASVVGEDSTHAGDVSAQLDETLRNLNALLAAAPAHGQRTRHPRSVRIYYVRPEDESFLRTVAPGRLGANEIEYIHAQLCRPELLVEIEAVYESSARDEIVAA